MAIPSRSANALAGALSLVSALALTFGPAVTASAHSPDPRSVVFARDVRPYGLPMATWGQLINQWIYAQPFGVNPVLDGCITGAFQPAIIDGFFMMAKPLEPGVHIIVVHGTNTVGDDRTYTYHLTVT
jgi:hypothetical protein